MYGRSLLKNKWRLIFIVISAACIGLWITNKAVEHSSGAFKVTSWPLRSSMAERRQLLREQCLTKPPNPAFIEEADFSRFIVIEKLKLVFCFIPKVSCTTWKRILYSAENEGEQVRYPHRSSHFSWLKDYSVVERKEILSSYHKAMFVREPFARLAAVYRHKKEWIWFKRFVMPNKSTQELKNEAAVPFSTFIKSVLSSNETTLRQRRGQIEDQHWRSYERICPCEVNYDFIGHFENIGEEAPQLLKIIGVDDYVTFPEYHPSKTTPYMLDYYSQLTKDEIIQLGQRYELDFKLFGYDFPGPLEEVLKNKTIAEEN